MAENDRAYRGSNFFDPEDKYYLTSLGKQVMALSRKLKNLYIIP